MRPKNNPVYPFEKFADIEGWLREQWAGLFRELLQKSTGQEQLKELSSQVGDLKEINNTLKAYLENVMVTVSPDESPKLIQSEERRLEQWERSNAIKNSDWTNFVIKRVDVDFDTYLDAMKSSTSFRDFARKIDSSSSGDDAGRDILSVLDTVSRARKDFNEVRSLLGLSSLKKGRKKTEK